MITKLRIERFEFTDRKGFHECFRVIYTTAAGGNYVYGTDVRKLRGAKTTLTKAAKRLGLTKAEDGMSAA